jgi:ABC-2 type transport system permease protein
MSLSDTLSDPVAPSEAVVRPASKTRPLYWSVRRELWENRSIYIAPALVAAVVLLGLLVGSINLHRATHLVTTLDASKRQVALGIPFEGAAAIILVASFIVAFFYCLSALQSERRDRSILFWKSLPVSDLTTVTAKAALPMVVLPVVTFLVIVATQLIILAASLVILPSVGLPATALMTQFPVLNSWLELAYLLICMALWHAPVWGWLMLVSGWARRATFLWAVGPPIGVVIFERLAFGTSYFDRLLHYRVIGGVAEAFSMRETLLSQNHAGSVSFDSARMNPIGFVTSPGLWTGLIVATALFAGVVWQRRYRAPL